MSNNISFFEPFRWKTFPRDFLLIQVGFLIFGLSIAINIQANTGVSAWVVLEVALANLVGTLPGTMTIIVGFFTLLLSIVMRERIGWGTIANMIFIGLFVNWTLPYIPSAENNFPLQLGMLLVSIVMMGFATALYIAVNAGAGPRDSLMLALHRTTGLSIRVIRSGMSVGVATVGWILGGPLSWGTLVFALLIGPAVQWGFKIFPLPEKG